MATHCNNFQQSQHDSRREFVRVGGLGLLGTTLPHLLEAREASQTTGLPGFAKAKRCLFLFMWGGPAQQDTWDMKPDAPAEFRGEFKPIDTNVPGVRICEHFPRLARRADKLALIRSVTHADVNHTTSTHHLLTGFPFKPGTRERDAAPHLGTVLAQMRTPSSRLPPVVNMMPKVPGDVPRFVEQSMGQHAGWLGPVYDPMRMFDDPNLGNFDFGQFKLTGGVTEARLAQQRRLVRMIDRQSRAFEQQLQSEALSSHYERAYDLLTTPDALSAFRLDREPDVVRDRYGRNPHGQCVLLARRLAEAGVPVSTVFWQNDGIKNVSVYWDTHRRNFIDLKTRLMPVSDQATSALLDDLQASGLLHETLVVWTGEFGRTPRVGQSVVGGAGAGADGRDHWPGVFTTVLAGAGVKGGTVYGASDRYAAHPAENPVRPADIVATIYHCLGVNPRATLRDRLGRPIPICEGEPIRAVLS